MLARAIAVLLVVTLLPFVAPVGAQAADAGLVLEALGILRERYVDPVDSAAMLNGAIAGLRATLSTAGIQADLPSMPAGTATGQAETIFRQRFAAADAAAAGRVQMTTLAHNAVRAMANVLNDSHTAFIDPEAYTEFRQRQRREATFTGIGIVLMPRDGRFFVRDVIPGTPAAAAGVQALDQIVRIDNVPTAGLQSDQVVGMIRGPAGTSVSIVLHRPGQASTLTVSVTRAPVRIPAVFQARVLEGGIGYLQLYQFVDRTAADVRQALETMLRTGMRALVLDVRGNSGGLLHELMLTMSLLLPPGRPIYRQTTRGGQTQTITTTGLPILPAGVPMVVLIDEGSGSSAELLAAALQENGRATLIGAQSGGAVEAAVMFDLSDGSGLFVTILRLASAMGKRLEGVGVTPDVPVTVSVADLDQGRDTQLQRALQVVRPR